MTWICCEIQVSFSSVSLSSSCGFASSGYLHYLVVSPLVPVASCRDQFIAGAWKMYLNCPKASCGPQAAFARPPLSCYPTPENTGLCSSSYLLSSGLWFLWLNALCVFDSSPHGSSLGCLGPAQLRYINSFHLPLFSTVLALANLTSAIFLYCVFMNFAFISATACFLNWDNSQDKGPT